MAIFTFALFVNNILNSIHVYYGGVGAYVYKHRMSILWFSFHGEQWHNCLMWTLHVGSDCISSRSLLIFLLYSTSCQPLTCHWDKILYQCPINSSHWVKISVQVYKFQWLAHQILTTGTVNFTKDNYVTVLGQMKITILAQYLNSPVFVAQLSKQPLHATWYTLT